MGEFYKILEKVERFQERMALATIIDVKGSFYRKAGASMLIMQNGNKIGVLSGGCLENDLNLRTGQWFDLPKEDFERLQGYTRVYDMRSEQENEWGRGQGCNGVVTVLVEPVTTVFRRQLIQVKHQMDRGLAAVSLRIINEDKQTKRAFVFEDGRVIGDKGDFKHVLDGFSFADLCDDTYLSNSIIRLVHHKRPRLVIIGAGDDAIPLAELAGQLGWSVAVADFRSAYCHRGRFPQAELCRVSSPQELLTSLPLNKDDAAILMTHDFQVDRLLLPALLKKDFLYFGVLGPIERTKRLIDDVFLPDYLHAPVGLPIDAEGPEEIAVSIMAEIIKVYRQSRKKANVACG